MTAFTKYLQTIFEMHSKAFKENTEILLNAGSNAFPRPSTNLPKAPRKAFQRHGKVAGKVDVLATPKVAKLDGHSLQRRGSGLCILAAPRVARQDGHSIYQRGSGFLKLSAALCSCEHGALRTRCAEASQPPNLCATRMQHHAAQKCLGALHRFVFTRGRASGAALGHLAFRLARGFFSVTQLAPSAEGVMISAGLACGQPSGLRCRAAAGRSCFSATAGTVLCRFCAGLTWR
jgi:hypothetical protein